jgi:hypothetical protein
MTYAWFRMQGGDQRHGSPGMAAGFLRTFLIKTQKGISKHDETSSC